MLPHGGTWRLVLRGRGQTQRARVRIQRIHGCERPRPSLCSLLHTPVPPHWQPVTSEQLAPPAGGTVNQDSRRHSALVFQLRHECLPVSEELLPPPALATPSALFSEHSVRGTRNKWNKTGRLWRRVLFNVSGTAQPRSLFRKCLLKV